jgi:hypothetical protein
MKTKIIRKYSMRTGVMLLLALFSTRAISQITITSMTITNATSCSICNGSAIANVSGGFAPYTYYWSNIGGPIYTDEDSLLCPGSYTVYVTDSRGDTGSGGRAFIIGPAAISLSVNTTNTSCIGNTGTATANVSGGTSPYTYSWTPGGGNTASISGLSTGVYSVSVTDAAGCSATGAAAVSNAGLTITLSITHNITCSGSDVGAISVANVSGGISPYTYSWSPVSSTNSSISGLSAGAYFVSVTDNNGCTGYAFDSLTAPPPISASMTVTSTNCTGNNGTASAFVTGGLSPYNYIWSPSGETTSNITGLSAGTYTLTITDASACEAVAFAIITSSGPISAITTVNDSCNGGSNGFASVSSVSGGVSPYTYSWSVSGNTTNSISGLSAGTYSVSVSDNTGCTGSAAIIISQPLPIILVADTIPDTGSCSGTAILYGAGGTGPYTFSWSLVVNIVYDSGAEYVDSLCYGSYYVCITDAHGCSSCDSVHIRHAPRVISSIGNIKLKESGINIYPDPVSNELSVAATGLPSGKYNLYVYDMIGRQVLNQGNLNITPGQIIPVNVSGLLNGKYILRISGDNLNKMTSFMVTH